jgi:hypothetical protein
MKANSFESAQGHAKQDEEILNIAGKEISETKTEVSEKVSAHARHYAEIKVEVLDQAVHERQQLHVPQEITMLEILVEGAEKLRVPLLPSAENPLDRLHKIHGNQVGEALNLELVLEDLLEQEPGIHRFGIELVLAIQINTRWRIASESRMSPKDILTLADLPWQEYSLYFPCDSVEPMPPDTPIELQRGYRFEAQRDGKYGEEVHGGY